MKATCKSCGKQQTITIRKGDKLVNHTCPNGCGHTLKRSNNGRKTRNAVKKPRRSLGEMVKETKAKRDNPAGSRHVVVNALAGTGKTFTLILGILSLFRKHKQMWRQVVKGLGFDPQPSPQQEQVWNLMKEEIPQTVTYVAFNRSIVNEFGEKWKWAVDILASVGTKLDFLTVHQIGFRACCNAYQLTYKNVNKWKTRNILEKEMGCDLREVFKTRPMLIQAVEQIVGLCKLNLVGWDAFDESGNPIQDDNLDWDTELDKLVTHYGIEMNGERDDVYRLVPRILERSRTDWLHEIDFNDQIWLPIVNNLPVPKVDLVLGDEAQDWNHCQQAVIYKMKQRLLMCGDIHQAIYGFAGADVDSIPRMTELLNYTERGVTEVPLTVTRRCGKAIVEEAQKLVPAFEAHESNHDGSISVMNDEKAKELMEDDDLVLCRTNAPLIATAFALIRAGRKANIQGRDIGLGLQRIIKNSRKKGVNDFLEWLDEHERTERERILIRKIPSEEALVALSDKCECLRIFCEGALTLEEVNKNINNLFRDKPGTGVLLSSVHRAKGLEADRVFILQPELMPHPMAKTTWAIGQEYNLKYVAITRAIKELVWIR